MKQQSMKSSHVLTCFDNMLRCIICDGNVSLCDYNEKKA